MVQLNYKASNIAKAEKEQGKNFFNELAESQTSTPSVSALMFLFTAGGGTVEEFDELFKKGVDELMLTIIPEIADAGFLGKAVNSKMVKARMKKAMDEAMAALENSGETENA